MDKLAVANEIRNQIGHKAFVMMGASNYVGSSEDQEKKGALHFKLGKGIKNHKGKTVTHVVVTLCHNDTYTVETYFIRGLTCKPLDLSEGVYVDRLRDTISSLTGCYLSL